jgi:hypothetical protein
MDVYHLLVDAYLAYYRENPKCDYRELKTFGGKTAVYGMPLTGSSQLRRAVLNDLVLLGQLPSNLAHPKLQKALAGK